MKTHHDALFIVMITLLFNFSKGTEVQKICRDDTAPFRLSCPSNTGVSIQSVSVQFTSINTINKECETLIFYNITENTRPFQDTCNRASDRSMCILDQGYVTSLLQPFTVPSDIYLIPIRLLFIYDCLGLTICHKDYNLTNYNLYCPNRQDFILITNLAGSFLNSASIPGCLNQPDFTSNSVVQVTTSICGYCINKSPCVFTRELIDQFNLFSLKTFNLPPNSNSKPISLMVQYQCLDRSLYNFYSQSIYCTLLASTDTTINYMTSVDTPTARTTTESVTTPTTSNLFSITSQIDRTITNLVASTSRRTTTSSPFIDYEYYDENVYCISRGSEIPTSKKNSFLLIILIYLILLNK